MGGIGEALVDGVFLRLDRLGFASAIGLGSGVVTASFGIPSISSWRASRSRVSKSMSLMIEIVRKQTDLKSVSRKLKFEFTYNSVGSL